MSYVPSGEWQNGLFSCDDKFMVCIRSYLLPHCTLAQARSDYDGSNCCFNLCVASHNPHAIRTAIRHGYGIQGSCLGDLAATMCCQICAIAQITQEVSKRGPVQTLTNQQAETPWSSDLINIGGDCIYALFCPACAAASARTTFDGSDWCYNCVCVHPLLHLSIIRHGYNISGSCIGDCCAMQLCHPCAIGRMKRETEQRGLMVAGKSGAPQQVQMN